MTSILPENERSGFAAFWPLTAARPMLPGMAMFEQMGQMQLDFYRSAMKFWLTPFAAGARVKADVATPATPSAVVESVASAVAPVVALLTPPAAPKPLALAPETEAEAPALERAAPTPASEPAPTVAPPVPTPAPAKPAPIMPAVEARKPVTAVAAPTPVTAKLPIEPPVAKKPQPAAAPMTVLHVAPPAQPALAVQPKQEAKSDAKSDTTSNGKVEAMTRRQPAAPTRTLRKR